MNNVVKKRLDELDIRALFLVWGFPLGAHRSQLMAQLLGMRVEHAYLTRKQGRLYALLKYPVQALQTLIILVRQRPRVVFVQDPPIFATLMVYLWGLVTGTKYVIDSHTDALLAPWWEWVRPMHRFLARRAITNLVTNAQLQQIVAAWGADAFILQDVPTTFSNRRQVHLDDAAFNIVFVSTVSYDEPIFQVLEAAKNLPDVRFYITGAYDARAPHIVQNAPANVHFTGYLPDEEFYGLLEAAQTVMCLTTENYTMQSGASEALWLGKPIITSDWPLLREYFNQGTIHVDNTAGSIGQAVLTMRGNLPAFQADILRLQQVRRQEWWSGVSSLIHLIQKAVQQ
jgi:glycosyltransferase involved in cell wall biosynthesis